MQLPQKGEYGYTNAHKKAQFIKTGILFLLPIAIFLAGYLTTGGKNNYFTIIALVGSLPACKEMVNVIMFWNRKSLPPRFYEELSAHVGPLTVAYELTLTTYEKNYTVPISVICENQLLCYAVQKELEEKKLEEHIKSILKNNGYSVYVHVFRDLKPFLDRIDALSKKHDKDPKSEQTEQEIKKILLAISM